MAVTRIHEDPRVTLPYTDAQWQRIQALGCRIDQDICAGDIRLTMGGEPTFVSIDNMDGAEWNIAALGPEKRKLAERLLDRLRKRFAPGGLLHYGQGKWYPGEPLPRWALSCYWRADGVPLWHDRSLLAQESFTNNFGPLEARHFADTWRAAWDSIRSTSTPPLKIRCTICRRSANFPSTSIPWTTV